MKKTLLLLFVIGAFVLQGCKKDEVIIEASLKGRWDVTQAKIEEFENNVLKSKITETLSKGTLYFVFAETKFEIFFDNQLGDEGTYTYNPSSKTINLIYSPTDSETLNVKTFTNTSLVIFGEEVETRNGITYKTVSEVSFVKE